MPDFDHKTLIAHLSPDDRSSLLERSDAQGLRYLALHIGGIVLCSALIIANAPFVVLIMLVQGILINFLFTTLHETSHRTPFETDALNIWVGRVCGFCVFIAPEWFRYYHFAHHRFTHDPEKDPELATAKPNTTWQYLKYLSGIPDWASRAKALVRNAAFPNQDAFVPERGRTKVMREARIQLGLYAAILIISLVAWSPAALLLWIAPIIMGGPFLRGYLLAEHARCPHAASMLENTRTTLTNKIVRRLAWNMPYHAEHHAYPSVPFHKLPDFHEFARDHIRHQENGYLKFNNAYLKDSITGVLSQNREIEP